MSQITFNQSRFKSNKASIANLIKKINSGQKTIIKKRVGEYQKFYEELCNRGLINNDAERLQSQNTLIEEELNILEIFNRVFKNKNQFISQFENYIVDHEKEFDNLEKLYEDCIEVIEKYYREYGLSIDDFKFLKKVILLMDK